MRDKGRQKAGGGGERISSTEQQNRGKQYTERENEHRTREAETKREVGTSCFTVSLLVLYTSLPVLLDGHWQPCERFLTYLWKLTSLFCSN